MHKTKKLKNIGNLSLKLKLEQEEMKRNEIGRKKTKKLFAILGVGPFVSLTLHSLKGQASQPASQKKKKLYNKNYAMGSVDRQ